RKPAGQRCRHDPVTHDKLSSSNCNTQARRHGFVMQIRRYPSLPGEMAPTFPAISCDFCAKPHPYAVHVTTTAVLLAAGGGSRFAGTTHKLLATIDGVPVFRRSLDHLLGAEFDRVVVVTGA